jgi:tetratricopeptide (TPR) repeat protein
LPLPRPLFRRSPASLRHGPACALAAACLCLAPAAPAQNLPPPAAVPQVLPANVVAANAVNAALRKGDAAGALKAAEDGLRDSPKDAQLRFLRAVVLGDLGRTDEAVAALEALNAEFPELPEPYNNLAVIRAGQGKYAEAEHLLQQALAAQAGYVTARENLGDLYVSMAIAAYEQAGRLDPANAAVKRKLALARELGGRLHGAHGG